MKIQNRLYYALYFLIPFASAQAQPEEFNFERLPLNRGKSSFVITALERDARGFLWIGTPRGLNRFDGVRLRTFTSDNAQDDIQDFHIIALAQDNKHKNNLWVATKNGGLSRFDSKTEQFATYSSSILAPDSNTVSSFFIDQQGGIWLGTSNSVLMRFSPLDSSFKQYPIPRKRETGASLGKVNAIVGQESASHCLWIGADSGLVMFNKNELKFYLAETPDNNPLSLRNNSITALAEKNNSVWLGTRNGELYRYDIASRQLTQKKLLTKNKNLEKITTMSKSLMFPDALWIGTGGHGLFLLNTKTQEIRRFANDSNDSASLSRSDVLSVHEDATGLLWVGTVLGLNKASLYPRRFKPILLNEELSNSDDGPSVGVVYAAPSEPNLVWLSVLREGLRTYDRTTGELKRYPARSDSLGVIFAIHEDINRDFWLGGLPPFLFHLERASGKVTPYKLGDAAETLITQIYEAPSQPGILWLAARDLGLLKFDLKTRQVAQIFNAEKGLKGNDVRRILEPSHSPGMLWLVCGDRGLTLLNTKTGESQAFQKKDNTRMPSDNLLTIVEAADDVLWVGSYDAGLFKFNTRENTCATYTTNDGLPQMDVGAIQKDSRGRLWLNTSNGLSLFEPQTQTFTNFTIADGLPGQILHYQASHQNNKGELFIGGVNGMTIFHPDSIRISTVQPEIALIDFIVDGESWPLKYSGNTIKPVELSYFQNDLTFEFAALDLTRPSENRYKVMLAGADEDWRQIGTEHRQRYPALSSGKYTFHVIGSNSAGYWSEEGVSFDIRILQPIWKIWWVWGIFISFVITLGFLFFQNRIRQLKRLEATRKQIADDLHDDIGSKMSSIALTLDVAINTWALKNAQKGEAEKISNSARGVVDDLRDAIWLVDAAEEDLVALSNRMKNITRQMLNNRSFHFQKLETLSPIPLKMEQRRHLFLMYKEMLNNVARHSKASDIEIQLSYSSGLFTIKVRDNGVGFEPQKVQQGRGMSTLRERAKILKGDLRIDSKLERGTVQQFIVTL